MRIFEPLFIFLLCGPIGALLGYYSGKSLYSAKAKLLPGGLNGLSLMLSAVLAVSAIFFLDFAFIAPEYRHLYGTGVRIFLIALTLGVSATAGYFQKSLSSLKQECAFEPKPVLFEKEE